MKKLNILILLLFIFFPESILINPISWPYLPASDYFRGTAGERLFFGFCSMKKGSLSIKNDFRNYHFNNYWSKSGEKYEFDSYSRMINILSFYYMPFNKAQFSIRIPFVKVENFNLSNNGLSDILLGFSYNVMELMNNNLKISLSTGLKIPVGYYEYDKDKIPIGTGSYDVPLVINTDFLFYNIITNLDIGYIFIGNSEVLYPLYNEGKIKENGDEIFIDFAVIMELNKYVAVKIESNYYNVFNSTFENYKESDSQNKLSITPGIIFSTFSNKIKCEFGFSYDLVGKNTFFGYFPVLRIQFNNL